MISTAFAIGAALASCGISALMAAACVAAGRGDERIEAAERRASRG